MQYNMHMTVFCVCVWFFLGFFWAEAPTFVVFSAKNANFEEIQKPKKDTICEHTCANFFLSICPFFCCIFHFCFFVIFKILKDVV